jgi:hypothetical protein
MVRFFSFRLWHLFAAVTVGTVLCVSCYRLHCGDQDERRQVAELAVQVIGAHPSSRGFEYRYTRLRSIQPQTYEVFGVVPGGRGGEWQSIVVEITADGPATDGVIYCHSR